ncbi:hypothetical protein HD554DRAFT_2042329 [Boletus coccyginus]|nr:hypothetical protein HD554DRAFT_2042329 [Boletus coccyginus]
MYGFQMVPIMGCRKNDNIQSNLLRRTLRGSISVFKDRNHIFNTLLSINKLLNPLKEQENLDIEAETFDNDVAIIAEVCQQEAVQNGNAIEVDSDDEDDPDNKPEAKH